MPVAVKQSCGSPSLARSWSTRPFLGRRLFTSCPFNAPLPQSWGGCLWFWLMMQAPSHSAIAMDAATGPITMTTPSPKPTPLLGQGTAVPCTLWILGRWVGPATSEVEWSSVCDVYCISLLRIITYYCQRLIVITCYFHFCYYTVITLLLCIITSLIIHVITVFVITL